MYEEYVHRNGGCLLATQKALGLSGAFSVFKSHYPLLVFGMAVIPVIQAVL